MLCEIHLHHSESLTPFFPLPATLVSLLLFVCLFVHLFLISTPSVELLVNLLCKPLKFSPGTCAQHLTALVMCCVVAHARRQRAAQGIEGEASLCVCSSEVTVLHVAELDEFESRDYYAACCWVWICARFCFCF